MAYEPHSKETRKLIQDVSRETAKCVSQSVSKKVVRETLVSVGIDPANPLEAQEMQANMRQIAAVAPALSAIAAHYADQENVEALVFAKNVHRAVKSTRNRAVIGISGGVFAVWGTGLWNKITHLLGG